MGENVTTETHPMDSSASDGAWPCIQCRPPLDWPDCQLTIEHSTERVFYSSAAPVAAESTPRALKGTNGLHIEPLSSEVPRPQLQSKFTASFSHSVIWSSRPKLRL